MYDDAVSQTQKKLGATFLVRMWMWGTSSSGRHLGRPVTWPKIQDGGRNQKSPHLHIRIKVAPDYLDSTLVVTWYHFYF